VVVNTIDNQPIAVTVGLTYRIPPQAVLPLLYEVGRAGGQGKRTKRLPLRIL